MKDKLLLEWDEFEIMTAQAKFLKEEGDKSSLEDIERSVYEDSDFWSTEWDDMLDILTDIMNMLNRPNRYKDKWKCTVNNFGWLNQDGIKTFTATIGQELLEAILPQCDCTFRIYKTGLNCLKIQNFHHDSPMGNELYFIRPMTIKEVEEE